MSAFNAHQGRLPYASPPADFGDECDFCGTEAPRVSMKRQRAAGWRRCGGWLSCPSCGPELASIRNIRDEAVR